jgi:hypothetical protein
MRGIQDEHMDINGWADIAYHFAIDNAGVIYEGRDIGSRGASVAGHNTGTIGVVVMGNFEQERPLDFQLTALQSLLNWLAREYTLSHLAAHGEFNPESVCPGQHMIPLLDSLARMPDSCAGQTVMLLLHSDSDMDKGQTRLYDHFCILQD